MKKMFARLLAAATAAMLFASPAFATPRFWVVNNSMMQIMNVYLLKGDWWSKDLLGSSGTIMPEDQVLVLGTPWRGCTFDVVVVGADDSQAYFPHWDVCSDQLRVNNGAFELGD